MNDAAITQILRERNLWWREPDKWDRSDSYLRETADAPFDYRPKILADIDAPGLYMLLGPRRVGKSVEIKRAIQDQIGAGVNPRAIIYCACNGFSEQDLRRLFVVGRNLTRTVEGPRYWFIDEVTAVDGRWPEIVKDARDDTELREDCVVLTGSSARSLRDAERALAGRRGRAHPWRRVLLPMGFRDFCLAIGGLDAVPRPDPIRPSGLMTSHGRDLVEELSFWAEDLARAWAIHLDVGGFPRAVADFIETGDVALDFAEDLWSVAKEDAFAPRVEETAAAAVLNELSESLTSRINASKAAVEAGLGSSREMNERIDGLVRSFMAWRCHRLVNGKPAAKGQRKVYFIDPVIATLGQRKNLVHPSPVALPSPDLTKLSEQQLGFSLLRSLETEYPGVFLNETGLMYEAAGNQREIDFVSPNLGVPIESKFTDRAWRQAALSIRSRHGQGIVATRATLDVTEDVWAVPTPILAWLVSGAAT